MEQHVVGRRLGWGTEGTEHYSVVGGAKQEQSHWYPEYVSHNTDTETFPQFRSLHRLNPQGELIV